MKEINATMYYSRKTAFFQSQWRHFVAIGMQNKKEFFKGTAECEDRDEIHDFTAERNYKNIGIIRTNKKK